MEKIKNIDINLDKFSESIYKQLLEFGKQGGKDTSDLTPHELRATINICFQNTNPDYATLKEQGKQAQKIIKNVLDVKLSNFYNIIAIALGFKNHNTLSDAMEWETRQDKGESYKRGQKL